MVKLLLGIELFILGANGFFIAEALSLDRSINPEVFVIQNAFISDRAATRLIIPALAIDAEVESVGLNRKGEMGIPKDPFNAAWLNLGANPGENNSVVIDGHTETRSGAPAIFHDLNTLAAGDSIYVMDASGMIFHYRIVSKKIVPYDLKDTTDIFSSPGIARLNLITCAGDWIPKEKKFDERLVVFAELIERNAALVQ